MILFTACFADAVAHVVDSIMPLSPQAASLARYGEYPVSHATGVPDITIPIYTVSLGNFSLPVSISYHASGIKLNDVASTVGLGWALNAGGAISRQVEGSSDLKYPESLNDNFGRSYNNHFKNYDNLKAEVERAAKDGGVELLQTMALTPEKSMYDTASDRYVYNFAGKTGVFRYSYEDGKFIPLNYSPMYIYCDIGNTDERTSSFYIADTDGITYYFDATECSGPKIDDGTTNVSTWYLTKVETPYGNIDFKYSTYGDSHPYEWYSHTETMTTGYVIYNVTSLGGGYFEDDYRTLVSSVPHTYICYPKLLSSIEWDGNKIMFSYAHDRQDVWKTRLTKIEVINSSGDVRKTVSLGNNYYWGNEAPDENSRGNYRMMLKTLDVSDEGIYTFDYNTGSSLPEYERKGSKETCHTDYWGYYNGRTSKYSVPKEALGLIYTKLSVVVEKEDYYLQNAADRSSDEHSMKLGTIKSITFPTGGKTEFEFEANKTNEKDLYGGLRVKSIMNKDADGNILQTQTYDYKGWQPTSDPPHTLMGYETYSWWGPQWFYCFYYRNYDTCVSEVINPYSNANPILYSEVTETFGNGEKVFYNYTFYPACDIFCGHAEFGKNPNFILPALNDYGMITPYLSSEVHYDVNGNPVATENYVYDNVLVKDFNVGNRLIDLFTYRYVTNLNKVSYDLWFYGTNVIDDNTIQYKPITAHAYQRNLVAKETIDNVTGVSVREEYTYDDLHRTTLPQTMTAVNSDGKTYTTEYKYTFEDDDPVSQLMAGDYVMPDFLVGERTLCDGKEMQNTKTKYVQHGEWFYPEYEYKSVLGGAFFETAHYDGYDDKGNPLTVISNAADTASVVWGYGSRLPVAKILGLGRSGLSSYASTVNSLETTSSPTLLGGKINELRTALKGKALVSGYTHKPLFGVASTIGENGYTVNYGYGADARLSYVNDAEGTMQTFAYNVKRPYGGTTSADNYVLTKTYLDASGAKATSRYQYCDDLGRPVLTADNGVNTAGGYVYTLTEYDQKGRTARQWLPVVGCASPQNIGAGEFASQSSTQYGDAYAYTENTYDGADRLSFSATPGAAWRSAGKGKAVAYVTNAANSVKLYHAALSGSSLIKDGYYAVGTLQGETVTDEDGLTLTTFTDKRGRKVLERRGTSNDTYFVYDDLDRLRFVLSPQYQKSGYKAQYAYEYRYDDHGNVVKKILPGCDVDQYWYDGANRLTFSSVNDVPGYGYRFMLYDKFARIANARSAVFTACRA